MKLLILTISSGTRTSQIGQIATGTSSVEVTTAALTGSGTIQVGSASAVTVGVSTAGSEAGQSIGSAFSKVEAINAASVPGLTATATNTVELTIAAFCWHRWTHRMLMIFVSMVLMFSLVLTWKQVLLTQQQVTDAINAQSDNNWCVGGIKWC